MFKKIINLFKKIFKFEKSSYEGSLKDRPEEILDEID